MVIPWDYKLNLWISIKDSTWKTFQISVTGLLKAQRVNQNYDVAVCDKWGYMGPHKI